MRPVDFASVIANIKTKNGFDADMFSESVASKHGAIRAYFAFPGEPIYGPYDNAYEADQQGRTPSQMTIDYNLDAMRSTLDIYADPKIIAQHVCTFVQGDFRSTQVYRHADYFGTDYLNGLLKISGADESYSFQFNDAGRISKSGRQYFTHSEIKHVQTILTERPDLKETFVIYQAAASDYFKNLSEHIAKSEYLSLEERRLGEKAATRLQALFSGSYNFMDSLLPAFCLQYDQEDPSHTSNPDAALFDKGYRFALSLGMFRSQKLLSDGQTVKVQCPAQRTLMAITSHDGEGTRTMSSGIVLAMIHGFVLKAGPKPQRVRDPSLPASHPNNLVV